MLLLLLSFPLSFFFLVYLLPSLSVLGLLILSFLFSVVVGGVFFGFFWGGSCCWLPLYAVGVGVGVGVSLGFCVLVVKPPDKVALETSP